MFEHSALEPPEIVDHPQSSLTNTRSSTTLTAEHSAHEPTALCTSCSSCARGVERSSTTLTNEHPQTNPSQTNKRYLERSSTPPYRRTLGSTLPEISSLPFPRRERCFLSTFVLFFHILINSTVVLKKSHKHFAYDHTYVCLLSNTRRGNNVCC